MTRYEKAFLKKEKARIKWAEKGGRILLLIFIFLDWRCSSMSLKKAGVKK